jgi:type VI protein secretion system component Hcp
MINNQQKRDFMSNPAYLWLTDENGSPMAGPSLVSGREGAIELKSLTHNVNIPVDGNTGRLTGAHQQRAHIAQAKAAPQDRLLILAY